MIIQSTQFGEFNVAEEQVLKFPEGLPGFPEEKAFAFIPYGDNSPLVILQSVTEPELTFFLVETFVFFPDYVFELDDQLAADYGFSPAHIPQVFSILTVRESIESSTANLAAPVVVNWQTRVAVQVVLERTPYSTRHPLISGRGAAQQTGGEK